MVEEWYPNVSWNCIDSRKFTLVPPFCAFLSLGKYLWVDLWVFSFRIGKLSRNILEVLGKQTFWIRSQLLAGDYSTILRCGVGWDTRGFVTCWISHSLIDSEATNSFPVWLWVFWTAYWNCQQVYQTIEKKKVSSKERSLYNLYKYNLWIKLSCLIWS